MINKVGNTLVVDKNELLCNEDDVTKYWLSDLTAVFARVAVLYAIMNDKIRNSLVANRSAF